MKTNQVRFTTYGTSQRNADLTFGIGVVGITQSPPSINDTVYMLYSYEGRSYVFGRALVSLIIPRCNWPEDHEFVAYCQSDREIEYCSPIDVEELSLRSICQIPWHLEKGQPIVDDLAISRIKAIFDTVRIDLGVRPLLDRKSQINEVDKLGSPKVSLWSRFVSWLYNEKPSEATTN